MRLKQSDIAEATGFSLSVVSRALSPTRGKNDTLSDETRRVIQEAAQKMGYVHNMQASCLRKGRLPNIGVFLPPWTGYLICDLVMGMSKASNERGFPLDFYFDMSLEAYSKFIDSMRGRGNSGIISYVPVFSSDDKTREKIFQKIRDYRRDGGKIIFLNAVGLDIGDIPFVSIDETAGGALAASHLLEKKCAACHVFHFPGRIYNLRAAGFVEFMRRNAPDSTVRTIEVFGPGPGKYDMVHGMMDEILKGREARPTGIFCAADIIAQHVFLHTQKQGMENGVDFHLVGYDRSQWEVGPFEYPRVIQPFFEIGRRGVLKLCDMVAGRAESGEMMSPELMTSWTDNL